MVCFSANGCSWWHTRNSMCRIGRRLDADGQEWENTISPIPMWRANVQLAAGHDTHVMFHILAAFKEWEV